MDPVVTSAVVKAATSSEAAAASARLWERFLGPTADVLGSHLANWTEKRLENVGRIARKAQAKNAGRDGAVNPRVAKQILDDGSYSDDEMMAEYYSGILAASKSPDGRDDMGLPWTSLVSSLSSFQVRMHYILYRSWALLLEGQTSEELWLGVGRRRQTIRFELVELVTAIGWKPEMNMGALLGHCVSGLIRTGLLDENYAWGVLEPNDRAREFEARFDANMTLAGMELYGWAIGIGPISSDAFASVGSTGTDDAPIQAVSKVRLLREMEQTEPQ